MVRKAIIDEAGRLYRNWRNRLHEYYLMFETKEEALKHVPEDVNGPDWKFLVDYFSSPSFEVRSLLLFIFYLVNFNKFHNMLFVDIQMISTKNKACRAKQRTLHTSGRKSFQAISFDAVRCQLFNLVLCLVKLHCITFFLSINYLTSICICI